MPLAVTLAVIAACCIGASDFLAGIVSRRDPSQAALTWTFAVVAAVAVPTAVLADGKPAVAGLGWGAAMGITWAIGIFALARGIAQGRVVVVVPIAGVLSAAIPVLAGLLTEGRPGTVVGLGIAIGVIAVALVGIGSQPSEGRSIPWSAIHGSIGGITTGLSLVFLDRAADHGLWPLVAGALLAGALTLAVVFATSRRWKPPRSAVGPATAMGLLIAVSFVAMLAAFRRGSLTVVAVVASQYPAVTLLLAARFWRQRPRGIQYLGVVLTLVAVALIAIG